MSKSIHKIVSHADDLDGVASAVLLTYYIGVKYKTQAEVMFAHYENVNEVIRTASEDATHLWISDLSVRDLELVDKLNKFTPETFYFFDHHADTEPFVQKIADIATVCFDSSGNKCAADLIWEYISPCLFKHDFQYSQDYNAFSSLKHLTKATHSRDLWINDVPEGESLSAVIAMIGPDKTYECLVTNPNRAILDNFTELMEFCVHLAEDGVNHAKNLAQKSMIKYFYAPDSPKSCVAGISAIAAFTTGCQSEIGDMFLKETPRAVVGLINLETLTISFRTTKDVISQLGFGVNTIAKTIEGGGGHTFAAGAPLSKEVLMQGPKALLALMLSAIDEKAFEIEGIKSR